MNVDGLSYEELKRLDGVWTGLHLDSTFRGKTILVTGATGLIGNALIQVLLYLNQTRSLSMRVAALARSRQKAERLFKNEFFMVSEWSEDWETRYRDQIDYVIHCAAETDSKTFILRPIETINSIVQVTQRVLEFVRRTPGCKMAYLSTMEVYGTCNYPNLPLREEDYGYFDILSPRSSYPQAKALAETMCMAYVQEHHCDISIARLGQVLSGNIAENDQRMFAQFVRAARNGEDIVLHTPGESVRTYCSMPDCVSALLYILKEGKSGEAYNVANEAMTHSVKEIANMVAKRFQCAVRYEILDPSSSGYLPQLNMPLSAKKLRGLGWHPCYDLKQIIEGIGQN